MFEFVVLMFTTITLGWNLMGYANLPSHLVSYLSLVSDTLFWNFGDLPDSGQRVKNCFLDETDSALYSCCHFAIKTQLFDCCDQIYQFNWVYFDSFFK